MSGEVASGAGTPVASVIPDFVGQIYHNTTDDTLFMAFALTSSDWRSISNEKMTEAMDANSFKIHDIGRLDLVALSAEPGDAATGMLAYSDGTSSTNGFGQNGAGVYVYGGASWTNLAVSTILAGTVTLAMMSNIATSRVLGRSTAGSGVPEQLDESTFKTMFSLTIGVDVQAYDADLTAWGALTPPTGDMVGTTDSQSLSNKTIIQPVLTLAQDTAPTPTDEGDIQWDTDDNRIAVGSGAATLLFSDDTVVKNRANHTGTQLMSTISDAGALATLATVGNAQIDALAVDTAELAANAVTLGKVQTIADDRILGNVSGGAAIPAELTAAQIRTLINVSDGATASTGALADLDTVGANEIDANAVTLAKLATIADDTMLGNITGGAAVPAALTATQIKTLLAIANTDVTGLGALALLNTVGSTEIDANAVGIAQLAGGTAGDLFQMDASGNPVLLGAGSLNQVLTSGGPGAANTWETAAGGGDVSKSGTPVNNQLAVWTADGVIEGDANLTWDAAELFLTGSMDLIHTAAGAAEHGLEIDVDAAGFGDIKAVDIAYTTGALAATEDEAAILVNIDESAATGGTVVGLEVLSTTGSAAIYGTLIGVGVNPLLHEVGTFGDMDSFLVNAVDKLTDALTTSTDVQMFVADNDTIEVGDAAKFNEIEFLLSIVASGAGITPTFEYSTGSGTWQTFTPTDGTNGMRNSGIVAWTLADTSSPAWAVGTSGDFLVRITRTRNSLATPPTEDLIQIAAAVEFGWTKDAVVTLQKIELGGVTGASDTTFTRVSAGVAAIEGETIITTGGGMAIASDVNTGTSAALAVTPDSLAGSEFGIQYVQLWCSGITDDTATGDGAAYLHIPPALNGMNLVYVHADVVTAGTTGTTDVQVHNVDNVLDMLSTKLTIDSAETGSDTAAAAAVINTSNDHVNTNDVVRIDIDAVSTTAAKGLLVTLGFQLP
jgi:hypothetical protein